MKEPLTTFTSEGNAKLAQGLLKSNDIDSIISPGSGKDFAVRMSVITGLDGNWQIFVKDKDVEKAREILELDNK